MRMHIGWTFAIAIGMTGCAHQSLGPSSGGITSGSELTLETAFHSVRTGERMSARADGLVVERVSDGAIRVIPEAGLSKVPAGVTDHFIQSQLQTRLGEELGPNVAVEADAGIVTLRGSVPSEGQAVQAIREAMNMNGVMAVKSEISYPTSSARGY